MKRSVGLLNDSAFNLAQQCVQPTVGCLQGQAPLGSWAPRAWQIMRHTEASEKVLSAVNLLVFLRRGVYRC